MEFTESMVKRLDARLQARRKRDAGIKRLKDRLSRLYSQLDEAEGLCGDDPLLLCDGDTTDELAWRIIRLEEQIERAEAQLRRMVATSERRR